MSYIYKEVEIDIDEIIDSLSKNDRKELFRVLSKEFPPVIDKSNDSDFNKAVKKLYGRGWQLTKEEEDFIINVAKRF